MLESTAAAHWLEHQLLSEWPHILQLGRTQALSHVLLDQIDQCLTTHVH